MAIIGGILIIYGLVTLTGSNPLTYGVKPTNYNAVKYITIFGVIMLSIGGLLL
jgi:hypothetical protein